MKARMIPALAVVDLEVNRCFFFLVIVVIDSFSNFNWAYPTYYYDYGIYHLSSSVSCFFLNLTADC